MNNSQIAHDWAYQRGNVRGKGGVLSDVLLSFSASLRRAYAVNAYDVAEKMAIDAAVQKIEVELNRLQKSL